MSTAFRAVQWNRHKATYDAVLAGSVALYILTVMIAGRWWLSPPGEPASWEDLRIRATGTCAFLMLTVVLSIGPLARLDRRFMPLLYNRRHFGVLTFLVALVHGWLNIEWYLSRDKLAEFTATIGNLPHYASIAGFPYEALGIAALVVLFLLAATSHDFWLHFLAPAVWKALHMAVYIAYGLLVMHVALGVMQSQQSPLIPLALAAAGITVAVLHFVAGWREWRVDRGTLASNGGWITVGPPSAIPDGEARIVSVPGGERIAVFRDGSRIGAISNVCAHQNGPLGEGRIIDGCVTCPWHGYQYQLEDGRAPAPFTDRIPIYPVRISAGVIQVDPRPLASGTCAELANIGACT